MEVDIKTHAIVQEKKEKVGSVKEERTIWTKNPDEIGQRSPENGKLHRKMVLRSYLSLGSSNKVKFYYEFSNILSNSILQKTIFSWLCCPKIKLFHVDRL